MWWFTHPSITCSTFKLCLTLHKIIPLARYFKLNLKSEDTFEEWQINYIIECNICLWFEWDKFPNWKTFTTKLKILKRNHPIKILSKVFWKLFISSIISVHYFTMSIVTDQTAYGHHIGIFLKSLFDHETQGEMDK